MVGGVAVGEEVVLTLTWGYGGGCSDIDMLYLPFEVLFVKFGLAISGLSSEM